MRRVRFNLWDRIGLIPVELVGVVLPLLIVMIVLQSNGAAVAILATAFPSPVNPTLHAVFL